MEDQNRIIAATVAARHRRMHTALSAVPTGSIPAALNSHPRLETIILAGSSLSGSLPFTAPTDSPALLTLDLSYNNLTGNVPANLPGQLQQLNVSNNQLSGSLPQVCYCVRFNEQLL